ncbi:MAG: ABC transporter permease [Lachnospiraceae bacterium]
MNDILLKNNNKGIVRRLSLRSLKDGKMRNAFVVLTIIISVALLSGLSLSMLAVNEVNNKQIAAMQHVIYEETTLEQAQQLRADERVSDLRILKEGSRTEIDDYVIAAYYSEPVESSIQGIEIVEGEYPTANNEVAVDKSYLKQIKSDAVLGDALTFTFVDGTTESFVISGLTDTGSTGKVYGLYFSGEYAKNGSQMKDVRYRSAAKIVDADSMNQEDFLTEIRDIGADYGIERKDVNENGNYVTSKTPDMNDALAIVILAAFILFVSILVIYSIFYISVTNRIRQFGQLRTLGATTKQIKKMVKQEGRILFSIGAPTGFIIGAVFAFALNPSGWSWKSTLITAAAILIADYLTVMLSVRKPSKIAGKASPIEASKASGYDGGPDESKELYRKITPFSLASLSSKRNRKRSRMTVFSLGISGVVFLIAASLMVSFTAESYARQTDMEFSEFTIRFSENAAENNNFGTTGLQLENPLSDELISKIMSIDGVNDIKATKALKVTYEYNNYQGEDSCVPISLQEMGYLNGFQKENTLDYNEMVQNKEILIVNNDVNEEVFGWRFQVGDTVLMRWYNGTEYQEDTFTIAGEIDSSAYLKMTDDADKQHILLNAGWFVIPEDLMQQMMPTGFNFNSTLMVSTDWDHKADELTAAINGIIEMEPLLVCSNLSEAIAEAIPAYKQIYSLIMGLSLFIILFGIINLINTLVTNVMARKQEFAMLQSIGLTNRQLIKMVQSEGLLLAAWNTVITLILGSILGYLIILLMKELGASYMSWQFPIWYFLAYVLMVIIVPVIISHVAIRLFKSKSVVERLRETE